MKMSLSSRRPLGNDPLLSIYIFAFSFFLFLKDKDVLLMVKLILYRTEIEWYPGKCLTQKILKKKPKKGSKNTKPITKTEDCESFFNFFSPPQVPEDEDDLDDDMVCPSTKAVLVLDSECFKC